MGLIASKTIVAPKTNEESVQEKVAVGGITATKFVVLNQVKTVKPVEQVKQPEPVESSSWRAEKQGRRSSFLDDMLS